MLVEVADAVEEVDDAVPDEEELDVVLVAVVVAVSDVLVVEAVVVASVDEVDVDVDDSEVVVSALASTCLSSNASVWLHRSTARIACICAARAAHPASSKHCCRFAELEP